MPRRAAIFRWERAARVLLALAFLVPAVAAGQAVSGHAAVLSPAQKQLQKILAKRHYWEHKLKAEQHQEWLLNQQLKHTHWTVWRQKNKLKREKANALAAQQQLTTVIDGYQAQIQSIQGQLLATRTQYKQVHAQAEHLLIRLRQLKARIKRESGNVAKAMVQIYQLSQVSPLETVLEAHSLTDFLNQQDLVNQIGQHDAGILLWAQKEHAAVHRAAAGYLAKMAELKILQGQEKTQLHLVIVETQHENLLLLRARAEFGRRKAHIRRTEAAMLDMAKQEATILSGVNTNAKASQEAILQDQQAAEKVGWIIEQETGQYPNIGGAPGTLQWPLIGPITQGFGPSPYAFEPAITYHGTYYPHFHTGIDIAAPFQTPIHAAAAGRVIFAGPFVPGDIHASYGLCVIIEHTSTLSTLYAHMDITLGLKVKVGDIVSAGQVIGYEGLTGNTTGPHLHFEVHVNGDWVNPLFYLPPEPSQ